MKPYIGIADFTEFSQVENMLDLFGRLGTLRKLHVGVMMSYKTFYGLSTRWANAWPPKEDLHHIFASPQAYNCLHYADYGGKTDAKVLSQAIFHSGDYINALQLDMVWPDPGMVADSAHRSRKPVEVILQIGPQAFVKAKDDPKEVVEMLRDYETVIKRVLLDKSMGKGLALDAKALLPFMQEIEKAFPWLGIGVAGGLGPTSMHLLQPLVAAFPNMSIDACAQLRPSKNAINPIDWDMAKEYVKRALEVLEPG